jgi:hypothetical protein
MAGVDLSFLAFLADNAAFIFSAMAGDPETKRPGMNRTFRVTLFLLLALRMSVLAMLVRTLRVLFGTARMLLALGVVALAVMFGGGTMCLGCVLVVFGSLVMFVSGHEILVRCQLPAGTNSPHPQTFQQLDNQRRNSKNLLRPSKAFIGDGPRQPPTGTRPAANQEALRARCYSDAQWHPWLSTRLYRADHSIDCPFHSVRNFSDG